MRRALWRFAATAVLTVLVLAAGAVGLAEKIARDEAIDDAAHVASRLARVLGGPNVYADPGHPARDPGLRRLDRLVRERVAEGIIMRVKIWAPDGTVLYSDERRQIGRRHDLEPQQRTLFGTRGSYAEVTDLRAEENAFDRQLARHADAVVEVYAGFESADGRPLLFEAYFPAENLLHHERELLGQLIPAMIAGPVVAALAMVPIVLGLLRTLRAADEQRMRWVEDLFRTRTEERRRIARDIHDRVLPGLAAVSLTLETAGQPGDGRAPVQAETVRQAARDVRVQIRHLRNVLSGLRTAAVARVGLVDALREQARPLVEAGVTVRIDPPPSDLTDRETQLIYGLASEGLRNVHQHADAQAARVSIRRDDRQLLLDVCDDGRGPLPGHLVRSDHGLGLLADTLAELGGELSLRPAEKRGAQLTVRLPTQRTPDQT